LVNRAAWFRDAIVPARPYAATILSSLSASFALFIAKKVHYFYTPDRRKKRYQLFIIHRFKPGA
jgi:hypothetical protein